MSDENETELGLLAADPDCFAERISVLFELFLKESQMSVNGRSLQLLVNFVILTRLCWAMKTAIRCGDAVAIEAMYITFIPIWIACGKHKYYQLGLYLVDEYYSRIPYNVLNLLRINRTMKLYDGSDQDSRSMAKL